MLQLIALNQLLCIKLLDFECKDATIEINEIFQDFDRRWSL